jgi:hypothetical protein
VLTGELQGEIGCIDPRALSSVKPDKVQKQTPEPKERGKK